MRSDRYRQRIASHAARGEFGAALANLDAWRAREPGLLEPELLQARIEHMLGKVRESSRRVLAAVRTLDCAPELALDVVQSLRILVEHDALIEWAASWPHRAGLAPADQARIAASLEMVGAHALAVEWVEGAVSRAPDDAVCRVNRALVRSYGGDFDGAREDAEHAIASAADPAIAHWIVSRLQRADAGSHHVDRLRARLGEADAIDAEYLQFALFKELDDLGDTAAAWAALDAGCRLVRARRPYDAAATERRFEALRRCFPLSGAVAEPRADAPRPIFIVGLHRSGSTLLESMLAAHPDVCGYGESQRLTGALRYAANHPGTELVDEALIAAAPSLDWALVRDRFLDCGKHRIGAARHVTEKLPGAFHLIGFIRHALPEAKIIHLRREPMDLCFANLRELFSDCVPHANAQADIAHYHGGYSRLMQHWHAAYPGFVLEVSYETLVRDPLATSRRVYDFCGLEWNPDVIDPANWSARAITTLSTLQARQSVSTGSIGRWRPYARQLEPLRAALGLPAEL